MYNFHVGQRVACINAKRCKDADGRTQISEGCVYTIDWCGVDEDGNYILILVGIKRLWFGRNFGYFATRFRPLIETDISIFQAMLSPTPVKQRESEDA